MSRRSSTSSDWGESRSRLTIDGQVFGVVSTTQDSDQLVEVDGVAHRFSRDDAGIVRAPSSALVVGVDVKVDDTVELGQRLALIEAMKMEMAVPAPMRGRVRDVFVSRNVQVLAGAPLFRLESDEADGDGTADAGQEQIDLDAFAGAATASADEIVYAFVLGFDVDPARARAQVDSGALSDQAAIAVLGAFADLCSLSPERQDLGQDVERGTVTSSREYFNTFLRSLDAEREGLPAWFVDRLSRAVARYGIDGLDPSDELAASLLRIFVAQQRRDDQIPVVMEVLDRQESPIPGLRETLDRLIEATRRRHPSIASMSRTVRYSLFDRPVIDGVRSDVSATMRQLAAELAHPSGPIGSDASDTSDRLVACPLPLGPIFAEGGLFADTGTPGPLLEVLTRRYYRIRALGPMTVERVDDHDVLRGSYAHHDRTVHIIAVRAGADDLPAALRSVASAAASVPSSDNAVADVYLPLTAVESDRRRRAGGRDRHAAAQHRPAGIGATGQPHPLPSPHEDGRVDVPARGQRGLASVLDGVGGRRGGEHRSDDVRRGHQVPRSAPDDRPPSADVAARELRDQPAAGDR